MKNSVVLRRKGLRMAWNRHYSMRDPTWKGGAKAELSYLWLEGGGEESVMPK